MGMYCILKLKKILTLRSIIWKRELLVSLKMPEYY